MTEKSSLRKTMLKAVYHILKLFTRVLAKADYGDARQVRSAGVAFATAADALGRKPESIRIRKQVVDQILRLGRQDLAFEDLAALGINCFYWGFYDEAEAIARSCFAGTWNNRPCCRQCYASSDVACALYCLLQIRHDKYHEIVQTILPVFPHLLSRKKLLAPVDVLDPMIEITACLTVSLERLEKRTAALELVHDFRACLASAPGPFPDEFHRQLYRADSDSDTLAWMQISLENRGFMKAEKTASRS